ncbi:MAG: ABC transporter [Gallionellales bacterium GWA2_60_142]|nr:MAG: ABC transporter [Gallionellales bacterium GWA2_60_142]HCI14258.1 ABC transporter [Gallionellaceae bacterium]
MHYSRQDMLWLIGSLSRVFRIPFDPQLITQQFPPPYSRTSLLNALQALDFKVGEMELDEEGIATLERIPFPVVAFVREDEDASLVGRAAPVLSEPKRPDMVGVAHPTAELAAGGTDASPATPVLLVKADEECVLFFRVGADEPETIPLSEFSKHFRTDILLVARDTAQSAAELEEEQSASAPQPGSPGHTPFGFRWFVPELMKHKRVWRDILIASFAIQLVGLVTPLFTQVIIDKVIVHQTQSTLIAIAAGLVMFMLFSSAMTWLRQYFVLHTGNRIDAVLGSQVFRHLLHLPLPYFEHRPTGTLVARLHGVETVREFISGAAVTLLLDLPFLFIFIAVMFWYSWQLTLIALLLLSLITALSFTVTPALRDKLNHQFLLGAKNQAFVTEYVAGMETVKSLQMEPVLEHKYGDLLSNYLAAGFATRQLSNSYNVVANALEQIMTLSILVVGALLVMRNDGFTIGMLVAFQMFAGRMSQPMLRLAGLWQEFQQADIAVKRLGDLMDAPAEPHALVPARARSGAGGKVELKNVSFRYSDKHPYLYRSLDLTLNAGKLSVLMGPSGCGKSTLGKMLQGFYWPTDGSILLDGYDIRHLAANELRANFGVVPQETRLFSGTLFENLQLANPHASFEEIVHACQLAEIHAVIEQLPQGYQTPVGENGIGLSGGQRQRIAIARALLKRPRVLIFDEAVSNLDQVTAEHFAGTINKLKGKVTMLFITHQLPKALQVDETIDFGKLTANRS